MTAARGPRHAIVTCGASQCEGRVYLSCQSNSVVVQFTNSFASREEEDEEESLPGSRPDLPTVGWLYVLGVFAATVRSRTRGKMKLPRLLGEKE